MGELFSGSTPILVISPFLGHQAVHTSFEHVPTALAILAPVGQHHVDPARFTAGTSRAEGLTPPAPREPQLGWTRVAVLEFEEQRPEVDLDSTC